MQPQIDSVRVVPQDWLNPLPLAELFAKPQPIEVDLGCGKGRFLLERARTHPGVNFLGIDRMLRRIRKIDNKARRLGRTNIRLLRVEGYYSVAFLMPPDAIQTYYILFPDPWPKKRHHKRRLLQLPFAELLASRLAPGGYFHVATDWQEYAEHILATLGVVRDLENPHPGFAARPADRPETKFENRGRRLGHGSWDTIFRKRTPHPGGNP